MSDRVSCRPRNLLSWRFVVARNDRPVGEFHHRAFSASGVGRLGGNAYIMQKVRGGSELIDADGRWACKAVRVGSARATRLTRPDGRAVTVVRRFGLGSRYELSAEGKEVGVIRPTDMFTRTLAGEVESWVDDPTVLLLFWNLIAWQRRTAGVAVKA